MQIGCMECGVSTYMIASSDDLQELKEIEKNHPDTWESEGGDGYTVIFNTETCKDVNDEQ